MKQRIAVVLLLTLIATACSSTDATNTEVTLPIYESLRLETPEHAVESLIDAYDDRDFVRAWFIFDADAQQRLRRVTNRLDLKEFRHATFLVPDNLIEGSGEHKFMNNLAMLSRFFEDAAELGYLHVDLAGAQILSTEDGDADANADASPSRVVTVRLTDESQADLWLTDTPTNRWRVHQIAIDGVDFDDSGKVFVNATCGSLRVRVQSGVECPSSESTKNTDVEAEIERLQEDVGNDINKQIEASQFIQDLLARALVESDENICAALQGNFVLVDAALTDDLLARAEMLIDNTCPGSMELLTNPPEVPPSGDEIGEHTVYGRLDLSTPEVAVETFGQLFTNEAFMLLLFSLDAEAQQLLLRSINNLDVSPIVDERVLETWNGVDSEAHYNSLVGNFASLMTEASATDLHLLDLTGPFEVVGTSTLTWAEPRGEAVEAQVVEARSEALGTVHFLMVESPSGRWRVRQVALDPAAFESSDNARLVFIAS